METQTYEHYFFLLFIENKGVLCSDALRRPVYKDPLCVRVRVYLHPSWVAGRFSGVQGGVKHARVKSPFHTSLRRAYG